MLVVELVLLVALVASAAGLALEDRPHMKRVDVSPVRPDSGAWLARGRRRA